MTSLFAGSAALGAPNDPLVSSDDFVEWFGLGVPGSLDLARIETALEIASADVRAETQQQLTVVSETITVYPPVDHGVAQFVLPQWPVTAVAALTVAGSTLVNGTDYVWDRTGVVTFIAPLGCGWSYLNPVSVAYTHGWDPLPRDIAGVVLSRAKRLYDAPDAQTVEKEALGDWSVTYTVQPGGLTVQECETLRRYGAWIPAS